MLPRPRIGPERLCRNPSESAANHAEDIWSAPANGLSATVAVEASRYNLLVRKGHEEKRWPAPAIAGVSLCYDGSLPEHLDRVAPVLDAHGLKATFFGYPPSLAERLAEWRSVFESGHELGSAFLYGSVDGDGLAPEWPRETLDQDFLEAQELYEILIPGGAHSFAFPAVRTEWAASGLPVVSKIVRQSIVNMNAELLAPYAAQFRICRSPLDGFNDPASMDLKSLKSLRADDLDADSLSVVTHLGISKGQWTVVVFNGLREAQFQPEIHDRFIGWLADRRDLVAIGPLGRLAEMLQPGRSKVRVR